ncbi:MAG TPA: XRE family transcriptional regulator [Pelotomaculum sp.]|jgi:transcriptional regulator with XRE-family HTH domain|nr:XRE family transcriptional regulator [Pelotomaculum sp.]
MPVADRIKKLRKKNKLSQERLAALLGVSRSSVNGWELGFNMPSTQYIIKMARLWHVSTDYLLGIEESQTLSLSGLNQSERTLVYSLLKEIEDNKTHYEN